MKKNTLTKWIFASAAMVVAFACQSKPVLETSDTSEEDNTSCPCHSGHASAEDPFTKNHTALNEEIAPSKDLEETSNYVIEIDGREEDRPAPDNASTDQAPTSAAE